MTYALRPLTDRVWIGQAEKRASQFSSTWTATERLLLTEVAHLRGENLVLGMDVTESDLRLDGKLRANAHPATHAVEVAFDSKHGPMLYRCDSYETRSYQGPAWQHNVRAIAKTLEALRAVDRHGAVDTGQQYAGFKALPAGRAMPASHMTRTEALGVLGEWGRALSDLPAIPAEHVNTDPEALHKLHRTARRAAHPDRYNGDQTAWDQVEQAAKVLGISS